MKKKHGFYEIENEADLTFSVQRGISADQQHEDTVVFLVEQINSERDLSEKGDLVIPITKEGALNLIEQLNRITASR